MFKKNKQLPLFLTLGATSLLIGAGVATYLVLSQRTNVVQGELPTGSQLIPQDALVAVSLSTNTGEWQQLRQYGTPETQAAFQKQLATLQNTFLTANGYDYQRDIQPWLGKQVMIAYLSPHTPQSSSTAPVGKQSTILVLPIDNPAQAQQLLEKPNSSKTAKFIERTYKGIQIRETEKAFAQGKQVNNPISTTVIGRSLVVTNDSQATERVIDTFKGATSLAATPGYTEALGKIQPKQPGQQPFAQVYFNVPAATAVAAANSKREFSPQALAQLQDRQGVVTTVTLEPEGMRFQGLTWLKPNSQKKHYVENNAKMMQTRLPSDTLMMLSGGNLQRLWQDYVQGAQANPVAPMSPDNLRSGVKSTLNADLEQDLLSWMSGEFSLSLIPYSQKNPSNFGAGVVFMVQASDRSRAEKSLKQLDEFMTKQYQFQVQEVKVNGEKVINWNSPLGGVTATHGWLNDNVAFMTIGAPVADVLIPQPKTTLAESALFQQTKSTELNATNGHFFIDIDSTINSGNLAIPQFFPNLKQFLGGMKAIGVTAGIKDDRSSIFDIYVMLKKVTQADLQPSPSATPKATPKNVLPPAVKKVIPTPTPKANSSTAPKATSKTSP